MLAEQRCNRIMEKLRESGVVRTSALVKEFSASSETIRKDIERLDKQGLLIKVHGGAVPITESKMNTINTTTSHYVAFETRHKQNLEFKHNVAQKATELISEGQSIALDSGTTSYEIALIIRERFQNLTIVTNSLKNVFELIQNPALTVIATGGIVTADEYSFVSDFASLILERLHVDFFFLTGCGISLSTGITDQRVAEVLIHNKMRSIAKKTIVVADSTKFGATSLVNVCRLDEVDAIITDDGLDSCLAEEFRAQGHNIITA